MVHSDDGLAYPISAKSKASIKQCFEVSFDDKTSVICDDEHLWLLTDGSVTPVQDLTVGKSCIPVAMPVEMPTATLPIDPYVLGIWLADGKHTSSEVSKPDEFIWSEIQRRGYLIGANTGKSCPTRTIIGIRGELIKLGLFRNKHIPEMYLVSSVQQRVDLLRGLMDGDGSANEARKQACFQSTSKQLSDDVKELVESLGCRVNQATTRYAGFGVTGTAYPLAWRPQHFNPFLLPRKADKVLPSWGRGRSWFRRVVKIEAVAPQVTQCISVASPSKAYLCTRSRIVTHNTGKPRPKWGQLKLNALHTFMKHPEVKAVKAEFYWTQTKETSSQMFYRDKQPEMWAEFVPNLKQMLECYRAEEFPPRQNGLCKAYCPDLECEFNGRKK
jgi:replicative DNA helicase